jgi:hypothetical protein
MKLKEIVRKAAIDKGVSGVMELAELCGLSYARTVKVWNGSQEVKIKDVITVLDSLGTKIKFVSQGE